MLVFKVLGPEQTLSLLGGGVKRKPAFVVGVNNSRLVDARMVQPLLDAFDVVFYRREQVVDFLHGEILAIFVGVGVGANTTVSFLSLLFSLLIATYTISIKNQVS
jgi:hypothetical protein